MNCSTANEEPAMATSNETKWMLRALVTLAKRILAEANATPEVQAGEWPAGQEWHELGHTSQHAFMHMAREEAGIPHEEYRALIEAATMESDELDGVWNELLRSNAS
jgi:hypothetical protein